MSLILLACQSELELGRPNHRLFIVISIFFLSLYLTFSNILTNQVQNEDI